MLTRETRAGDAIVFTYDARDGLASKAAPGQPTVTYGYDLAGRLTAANDNSSAIASVTGSAASYATTLGYDVLNRVTSVGWTPAAAQTTPSAATVTFEHAYDATNRRVGQTTTDDAWWSVPSGASSTAYTANNLNQYTAVGGAAPTYDGNGNLTFDGTFTYGYDSENRLLSIADGGTPVASYAYDAQGRRKSRTVGSATTIYVTDADNREVLEHDGTTGQPMRWYSFGLGIDEPLNRMELGSATRATLIPDIQGSIVGELDSASGTLTTAGYQPYGENPNLADAGYRYTARRLDPETAGSAAQPSGLYYYRARMYSPALGRFMQPDPIGYDSGRNLYAYVANNPLNLLDPLGLSDSPTALARFANYFVSGLELISRAPADLAEIGSDFASAPFSTLRRLNPTLAGLGMAIPVGRIAAPPPPSAVSLGIAGEEAAGIAAGTPKTAIRMPGSTTVRYPDRLTPTTIEGS